MAHGKGWLRAATLLISGLLSACNLWGTNMKATDFFEPQYVELLEAIQQGNESQARTMLEDKGMTLNTHGNDGITPLFWLIMQGDSDAVALALKLGADPNFTSKDGRHPVPSVAGGNDDRLLGLLLEYGGDPDAKDLDGEPALFDAIGFKRWDQIKMLLDQGVDPDLTDRTNTTSTQYAAMLNQYEIVHYLIEFGADYRKRDEAGADVAWVLHDGLSNNLINPDSDAYKWAQEVKQQLEERGVEFPPPSPEEVREQWEREGK